MKYDLDILFTRYGVPHDEPNHRGWVELDCPECGGVGRLGWSPAGQCFKCWLCGMLPLYETLAALLGVPIGGVKALLDGCEVKGAFGPAEIQKPRGGAASLVYPVTAGPLQGNHIAYLRRRKLDPAQVEQEFGKQYGTLEHDPLLPNRLVAPLYYQGKAVSWQARNIHTKCPHALRYHTCPPEQEVTYHKDLVYGLSTAVQRGRTGVVVEGLFDVWKCGPGAMHTFGTAWLPAQLLLLAASFKRVYVMFDSKGPADPLGLAQQQGQRLAEALSLLGVEAFNVDPESAKDPGDWEYSEARSAMAEFGIR